MNEKKFVAHGEIETDGSLTIRGLHVDKFVVTKNVKSFDVWLVIDSWSGTCVIETTVIEGNKNETL